MTDIFLNRYIRKINEKLNTSTMQSFEVNQVKIEKLFFNLFTVYKYLFQNISNEVNSFLHNMPHTILFLSYYLS